MFYIAQANIDSEKLSVKKGQAIKEEVYNSLPGKLKIKFIPGKVYPEPIELNQVINVKKTRGK